MTNNTMKFAATMLLAIGAIVASDSTATAQTAVLAEVYGRGVHAFYAGQHQQAHTFLSSAIDNGIKDPRAYYFRGIVNSLRGSSYEAESDWRLGAQMEAASGSNPSIGRSLSRFQGSARLQLEQIRQTARLQHLTTAAARSDVRRSELGFTPAASTPAAPTIIQPANVPGMTPPASVGSVAPPPTPPAADNPFKDDTTNMGVGEPMIEADDALEGTLTNPFVDDAMAGGDAGAAAGGDPFGGGGDAGGAMDDPFGGGGDAGGAMDDPFGGGGEAAGDAMDDPFGGGGEAAGDSMDDPFGGSDPFGN